MNKKFAALTSLAVSVAMIFAGCGKDDGKQSAKDAAKTALSGETDKIVVAEVNGEAITMADFNFQYYESANQYKYYASMYGGSDWESMDYTGSDERYKGKTYGEFVRENTLEQQIQLVTANQKAAEYGLTIDDDVKSQAKSYKDDAISQSFGDDTETYNNFLADYYISDASLESYFQKIIVMQNLVQKLSEDGGECSVSDDVVKTQVDDSYLKVKHVLIQTVDSNSGETVREDAEALALANEVVAKLQAGEDMAQLVKDYGEDPGMEQQDYYVFTEGEMVDEFYQASKALKPGEFTAEPVKSSYGYHVIYRYEFNEDDEKYSETLNTVKQDLVYDKYMELVDSWVSKADVKKYDDVLQSALDAQNEAIKKKEAEEKAAAEAEAQAQQDALLDENKDTSSDGADDGAAADGDADSNADSADDAADDSNSSDGE